MMRMSSLSFSLSLCFPLSFSLCFPTFGEPNQTTIMEVKDSNGTLLSDGDNVTLIKDLKLRGSSTVLKRGTMVKGIRLTDDADEVEARVNKQAIVLRTEFLKKA
jgi:protein PhnA